MTWLTWRQHRREARILLALLLALGVGVVLLTVLSAGALAEVQRACAPGSFPSQTCLNLQFAFASDYPWEAIYDVAIVLPAFVGAFVGAPLVAGELEHDTHLLVWAQEVTRRRWFLQRVARVLLGAAIFGALLAAAAQGWFAMERQLGSRGYVLPNQTLWGSFALAPPVVIAYTLFAVALGIAAGALTRRSGAAALPTLVGFVAVRVVISALARPRYLAPISSRHGYPPTALQTGFSDHLSWYQPVSRFWLFQGIEAAIFAVLALALAALAYRLVVRVR